MKKQEIQTREENKPSIRDRFDRLFRRPLLDPLNTFWGLDPLISESAFATFSTPSVDISETDKEIHVKADVPGYKADDIDVEIDENTLIIRGKTEEEKEEKGEQYLRRERSFGEFQRIFPLPNYVDTESINCECKNGILKITIPKKQTSSKAKRIEVKSK